LNLKIVEMAPSREDATSLIRVTCIDSDSAEEPGAVLVNRQTRSQLPLKNQEGRLGRPSDEDPGGRVAQETVTVTAALSVRVLCTKKNRPGSVPPACARHAGPRR
jgi:hypothetical protein